jgi:hypothetical protein
MADEIRVTYGGVTYRAMLVVNGGSSGATADQVQGTAAGNAAAVGNPIQAGGVYETTPGTYDNNDAVPLHLDTRGNLKVTLALADSVTTLGATQDAIDGVAGSAASQNLRVVARNTMFNGTSWDRARKANATSRIASAAASVNATVAKASAGDVFRAIGTNAKASIVYLKIYNKATAPTVGTDVPVITVPIPASSSFNIDLGGYYLGTGISYGFTTDAADAGTTALLAADILGFTLLYA